MIAESLYFETLLHGTDNHEVTLPDTPLDAFELVLKYIYGKDLELDEENIATLSNLFMLAGRYKLRTLKKGITEYLRSKMDVHHANGINDRWS